MSDSDSQRRSQSPDNAPGNRSRSREQQRGRPLRRQVPTPFRSPPRRNPPPVDQRVVFGGYVYQPPATAAPTPAAAPHVSPSNSTPGTAQNTPLPADSADDVDMGDDDGSTFVYNAPALPQPPTFNGSTKAERRTFIRQYNKYLDQINALHCNSTRPFVMPVSACMDVSTKKRLAMWTFGNRDYRTIEESEWEAWFGKAFDEEPQDLEVLKKRLTSAIRFNTSILDADSRIEKMLEDLMKALERDDQTWVLEQEGKIVVDIMVKAIKPTTLQKSVVRQLAMNRNKPLKSDVFRFVEWLRVHTAGYQLYAPVDEEKPPAPPKNAKIEKSNDSGGGGADRGPPANEQPTRCHASKTKTQVSQMRQRRPQGECLSQADRLLKEQLEKWEDARKKVAKLNQPVHQSLGREAKIEDTVSVSTTLLDTGSDVTLVTASVINSLEDAGVSVETVSCDAIEIQPYGQTAALKVDRQVQFKLVTLETPCGPLALRGLKAWVDSTTDAAELLISRAVMERLGFSEDDFLSHAYTKQEVWDVSDVDKPSDFARINRLTQAAVPDECGDDGLSGATPDIQVPPPELSNAERGRRQAV
ncbi:unnamed protein product, partial [Aphanomyces euteiches]